MSRHITIVDEKLRKTAQDALNNPTPQDSPTSPALDKLTSLGTELWLDTGNLEEAQGLWHKDFTALTTNNTLANQVVQTGVLDEVAREALADLRTYGGGLTEDEMVMELGFIVNCHIALRLVKAFGVKVSVELHPAVSHDIGRTVAYAERYYAICPERFIIKIPLTPEGYCAVAQVRAKGIPVNYTLGFSARQNYLAALLSGPTYCNVFLGRLNAVIADNGWGDGVNVGEKAEMATQVMLREARATGKTQTKLIAASMRSAAQVSSLAGTDVYTIPPKAVKEFLTNNPDPASISSQVDHKFEVSFSSAADVSRTNAFWDVDEKFKAFAAELVTKGGVNLTGNDIRLADSEHGTKLFYPFTEQEMTDVRTKGKIPDLARWPGANSPALDDLMTQSALQSFIVDQGALDEHLLSILRAS
ncbi:MAG: transaldolase family protein [Chthonomonadales bacterium]